MIIARRWIYLIFSLIVLISLMFMSLMYEVRCLWQPAIAITVNIPRGSSLRSISQQLTKAGVIRRETSFMLLCKLLGNSQKLGWGEYEWQVPIHPWQVRRDLLSGKVKSYAVTIPEGFNLLQIAPLLEQTLGISAAAFISYARSKDAVSILRVAGPTLEGYLYPTTYHLNKSLSIAEICRAMVEAYQRVMRPEFIEQARKLHLNERQLITLASIIEKESANAAERPLIASVYHNRLRIKMRLQADPTVIYGIDHFDGNLTKKHLLTPSSYNTYQMTGLPYGPIANPGLESILAALNPATTDYLYFVATGGGLHQFSRSYAEHARAVERFQIKPHKRKDHNAKRPQS